MRLSCSPPRTARADARSGWCTRRAASPRSDACAHRPETASSCRRRASRAMHAPEPLEITGGGFDVSKRLCEPGLFVIGELDFTDLDDVAPGDRLRLYRHPLCDVDHRRHRGVL